MLYLFFWVTIPTLITQYIITQNMFSNSQSSADNLYCNQSTTLLNQTTDFKQISKTSNRNCNQGLRMQRQSGNQKKNRYSKYRKIIKNTISQSSCESYRNLTFDVPLMFKSQSWILVRQLIVQLLWTLHSNTLAVWMPVTAQRSQNLCEKASSVL